MFITMIHCMDIIQDTWSPCHNVSASQTSIPLTFHCLLTQIQMLLSCTSMIFRRLCHCACGFIECSNICYMPSFSPSTWFYISTVPKSVLLYSFPLRAIQLMILKDYSCMKRERPKSQCVIDFNYSSKPNTHIRRYGVNLP